MFLIFKKFSNCCFNILILTLQRGKMLNQKNNPEEHKKIRVYLASALGFSEAGRYFLFNALIPKIKNSLFEIINPWEYLHGLETNDLTKQIEDLTFESSVRIGTKNIHDIDSCDIVFAVVDGSDVDSGVSSEIGYAFAKGKKVIAYRGDFRSVGDSSYLRVNLQIETFISLSEGRIFNDLKAALSYLEEEAENRQHYTVS